MNMLKCTCAALAAVFGASASFAAPEITIGTVTQGSNRLVTVPYTLANEPAVVTFAVETNGPAGWARVDAAFTATAKGDLGKLVAIGDHAITWRPNRDLKGVKLPSDGVRFAVTAWPTNNPPAYMVINLLPGAADRVRYYEDEASLPYGGVLSNDIYRTTSLVMKKVMAKGVKWTMGSSNEQGRQATYEKQHTVELSDNYYLAVFPLTYRQNLLIYGSTAANYQRFKVDADMRPADNVPRTIVYGSVGDASVHVLRDAPDPNSICGKLKTLCGVAFNLPGEAQWEFACRAGCPSGYWPVAGGNVAMSMTAVSDGGKTYYEDAGFPGRYRWNGGNPVELRDAGMGNYVPVATVSTNYATSAVGTYSPNAWGFYDMLGNVYEPCLDWFKNDISEDGGAVITEETSAGHFFVSRGGDIGCGTDGNRPSARTIAGEAANLGGYGHLWGARLWAPCEAK